MNNKNKDSFNPYMDNVKIWNYKEAQSKYMVRVSFIISLFCISLSILSIGALIYHTDKSKYIPYIVEVDKLGSAVGVKPAELSYTKEERIIKSFLSRFIKDLKLVTSDINVQKQAVHNVYSMLNEKDISFEKILEFYKSDLNPFELSKKIYIEPKILSVIPQIDTTWEVDWIEEIRNKSGKLIETKRYRAILTYYFADKEKGQSEEYIFINPLKIYIKDINFEIVKDFK